MSDAEGKKTELKRKKTELKRTDLDMLCKSTDDASEVASGIKERMNVYGLVMALLITMTWSADGFGLTVSDDSMWGDAKQSSKDSVITWYALALYLATAAFMLGIMSVVEILDRTAVTPLQHSVRFFLDVHDTYTHMPNFFLQFGVIVFAIALLIQASVVLPLHKFVIYGVLVLIGIFAIAIQQRHGIWHNRNIVDDVVAKAADESPAASGDAGPPPAPPPMASM